MKISIIVPIYNVAEYLEACIRSCLNQALLPHEYEILLIDDGSDDSCPEICKRYSSYHEHIFTYTQPNTGQGAARNLGLTHATGEYVWFVDADDKIHANSLGQLYEIANSNKLDMLAFRGAEIIDGEAVQVTKHNQLAQGTMPGKDYLFYDHSVCVPFYIFHKGFLDESGLRFMEGVFHEDEDFALRALYHCRSLGFLDKVQYDVTLRQGSITRSVNSKKAYDLISVSENLSHFLIDQVEPPYRQVFYNRISMLLNSVMLNASRMSRQELADFLPEFRQHGSLFMYMRKSNKTKYRMEGWLFYLFPRHMLAIYKIVKKCF